MKQTFILMQGDDTVWVLQEEGTVIAIHTN